MNNKPTKLSVEAARTPPKPQGKKEMKRFLHEMAKFEAENGRQNSTNCGYIPNLFAFPEAKNRASAPSSSSSTKEVMICVHELPSNLNLISSSLRIDEPYTPMRIGQMSTFTEKWQPSTGQRYWIGFTWAETFQPVEGGKRPSLVGSKAYEVVLKQPIKDGGQIVRDNVTTTGRVVGTVVGDLPHETVSVRIEDWFVKSDVWKKGHEEQRNVTTSLLQVGSAERGDPGLSRIA